MRIGWRNLIGYGFVGGPRYVGTNLAELERRGGARVTIELYGREFGDFYGALLEGADLRVYGQGQSHWGMKADSGYVFVLQDALNTVAYAAHGGTISLWDSGLALRGGRAEQGDARRRPGAGAGTQVDPLRLTQRVRIRVPDVGRRELAARGDGAGQARWARTRCRSGPNRTRASS